MKSMLLTFVLVGLSVCGCNRNKADVPADASVIPATPASAVAVVSAEPLPSASAAAVDENAAPAASSVAKIPVQEDYEKKAKTVVSSKASAAKELTKIEKEIGE